MLGGFIVTVVGVVSRIKVEGVLQFESASA